MTNIARARTLLAALPCLLAALLLHGCDDGRKAGSMTNSSSSATRAQMRGGADDDLANAEWGEIKLQNTRPGAPQTRAAGSASSKASDQAAMLTSDRPWTIVLATIPDEAAGDQAKIADVLMQIRSLAPGLEKARVIRKRSGLVIGYGAYADVRDADAQRDLQWIKSITVRGGKPFATSVLTRALTDTPPAGKLNPFDLRAARQLYPNVNPLYTLQIAVWSDFDSGQLSLDEIHRNAEKQVAELRAKGNEAYFYHDDAKRLSVVTVGLFDSSAMVMDKRLHTPVVSDEVEILLKKFPAHLVNGEPVQEAMRKLPGRDGSTWATYVQKPRLVLVP